MNYDKQLSDNFCVLYHARYCAQEDLNVAVCKGGFIKMLEPHFSLRNFTSSKSDFSLPKFNCDSKLVVSGSNLYLFGECWKKTSLGKFSQSSKHWNVLPSLLDERNKFCVCSFMQKIIVIGGYEYFKSINSCMAYDIKTNKWNYIASINKSRIDTSSTVFKGKVVVTGGWKFFSGVLKSVEAYCFYENKWTRFPDMLKGRCNHGTVSIGNKMFVITIDGINDSEVFNSITNKFTFIKINPHSIGNGNLNPQISAISVGYKIYVFQVKKLEKKYIVSAFCYDVKQ